MGEDAVKGRRSIGATGAWPSLLASGAADRLGAVAVILVLLWLAVIWALSPAGPG